MSPQGTVLSMIQKDKKAKKKRGTLEGTPAKIDNAADVIESRAGPRKPRNPRTDKRAKRKKEKLERAADELRMVASASESLADSHTSEKLINDKEAQDEKEKLEALKKLSTDASATGNNQKSRTVDREPIAKHEAHSLSLPEDNFQEDVGAANAIVGGGTGKSNKSEESKTPLFEESSGMKRKRKNRDADDHPEKKRKKHKIKDREVEKNNETNEDGDDSMSGAIIDSPSEHPADMAPCKSVASYETDTNTESEAIRELPLWVSRPAYALNMRKKGTTTTREDNKESYIPVALPAVTPKSSARRTSVPISIPETPQPKPTVIPPKRQMIDALPMSWKAPKPSQEVHRKLGIPSSAASTPTRASSAHSSGSTSKYSAFLGKSTTPIPPPKIGNGLVTTNWDK
ncbi:uncharacterized protein BCR38DRAFT_234141 [Pseudomassariella vexata]|uniref:Uncharacterized protein n=1 Tax=Pseudomassariella vexata TaxID=1141098 RepID=A0A1Y2DU62_9PEZI|nr:uncharacterized protein BCR38DRAFT_234141 [Pseudomassariella vexata]ORY62175.1 hypothetical protein BCR38DRAFT_234141 [Pseudomassariella vexata]